LQYGILAVFAFMGVKCLMLYITLHYHYRAEKGRNGHSKDIHRALTTLYAASIYTKPVGYLEFEVEDGLIRNPESNFGLRNKASMGAHALLNKIGYGSSKSARYFGDTAVKSHWFGHGSAYAVVERALGHEKSSAALATRIWKSLVVHGEDQLVLTDIQEVLGPHRLDEAKVIFGAIDENDSKSLTLEEMVWTVIEAGRIRYNIYKSMACMNHCLTTFEMIMLFIICSLIGYFALISCKSPTSF
jgi:hypothetical protein